ncbi:MAG: Holliday junction branch migration protein RuvA [Gammaproteobacteria bacterium]|nr:Holliday junction branch migration protein RuvA [Gammaproteobacteria bacterium]
MIGRLRGTLLHKQPPMLLIEVGGVGYDVEAPLSTFSVLPAVNREAVIHTHLAVREDAQVLYGFATLAERDLFRDLIKVSGIGAKLALTILSGTDADELARCVRDDDVAALTRLPGIGRKTAQRLLVELRDRLPGGEITGLAGDGKARPQSPENDAREALISLGFKPDDAARRLREVADPSLSAEELIRRALQATVRG